jgi:hypothetical protein
VSSQNLVEARLERDHVQLSRETHDARNVVGRLVGIEAMYEPDSLLIERKGGWALASSRSDPFVLTATDQSSLLQPVPDQRDSVRRQTIHSDLVEGCGVFMTAIGYPRMGGLIAFFGLGYE